MSRVVRLQTPGDVGRAILLPPAEELVLLRRLLKEAHRGISRWQGASRTWEMAYLELWGRCDRAGLTVGSVGPSLPPPLDSVPPHLG